MIRKKDTGNGKTFWSAVTADRIILPNGTQYEQLTYAPTGWYLFIADDEYWLYPAEEIEHITSTPDSRLVVHPVGQPYVIYDKSKYKYELDGSSIMILENSDSVSHPPHYANGWSNGAEVIDLTEHLSFCAGNVVKYVCRAGRKDPDKHVEDLEKARWYLDREIERVDGGN
nr:MAG TPA: nucelotide kinase [Caudoviricetes sp.]